MYRWVLAIALSLLGLAGPPTGAGAANYFEDAQRLLEKGQLRAAEIQLKNAVRSDPANMAAHYRLATVLLQLGADGLSDRRRVGTGDLQVLGVREG